MFTKKGEKVVEMNIEALNQGYTLMKEQLNDLQIIYKCGFSSVVCSLKSPCKSFNCSFINV
jgi:hypothetical protein